MGSSLQDDVMMPQRVRLQLEAAVGHPTSVSADLWFCVFTASDEIVITAFFFYLFIFLVEERPAYSNIQIIHLAKITRSSHTNT